jgi:hypothetical protein
VMMVIAHANECEDEVWVDTYFGEINNLSDPPFRQSHILPRVVDYQAPAPTRCSLHPGFPNR